MKINVNLPGISCASSALPGRVFLLILPRSPGCTACVHCAFLQYLTCPGRPHHQDVIPARCGHFEDVHDVLLACEFSEIREREDMLTAGMASRVP